MLAAVGALVLAMAGAANAADLAGEYGEPAWRNHERHHVHRHRHPHHHYRLRAEWQPSPEPIFDPVRPDRPFYCERYLPVGVIYNAPDRPAWHGYTREDVITARY